MLRYLLNHKIGAVAGLLYTITAFLLNTVSGYIPSVVMVPFMPVSFGLGFIVGIAFVIGWGLMFWISSVVYVIFWMYIGAFVESNIRR